MPVSSSVVSSVAHAFDQLPGWGAATVAAGVSSARSTIASTGPTGRSFPLASVTKVLVALACWVAVEEETLDLDGPAGPTGSTVRHLLAHASGLTPDDHTKLAAPVGQRRIYSNAGFEVLGDVLAAAAGIPLATYVHEAVVEPLGLSATSLAGSPASGAVGSVDDLLALGRELLTPTLVSRFFVAEAIAPVFPELAGVLPGFGRHDPNPWGLGVEVRGHKQPHWTGRDNSPSTFGHFGRSGTFLWVDPAAGLLAVALADRDFGVWATRAWPTFSDALLGQYAPGGNGPGAVR